MCSWLDSRWCLFVHPLGCSAWVIIACLVALASSPGSHVWCRPKAWCRQPNARLCKCRDPNTLWLNDVDTWDVLTDLWDMLTDLVTTSYRWMRAEEFYRWMAVELKNSIDEQSCPPQRHLPSSPRPPRAQAAADDLQQVK